MSYYFKAELKNIDLNEAIDRTKAALKEQGFGVLTEIDIQTTLKNKLDADIEPYVILGACSPKHAYQAIQAEPNIGVFLPCNVIVKQRKDKTIEVSAVDPIASMQSVENEHLGKVAQEVEGNLKRAIENLK